MEMPERGFEDQGYRFGFQGQETDQEFMGGAVSYKYRVHDARIGRFLSVDPLAPQYPFYSPYQFSGNSPIIAVELEGLEPSVQLNNGETVNGAYSQEYIDGFNEKYDNATANGATISPDVWNFESYIKGESIVGNYIASSIQKLPNHPSDYEEPAEFALSGVKTTYDAARKYGNCGGNCYSTTASRINKGFEDLFNTTPIDYSENSDGTFSSKDYRTASGQKGSSNYGYGVGGALANGGEASLVNNAGVWNGDLKPGAALQLWRTNDTDNLTANGGHSLIFLKYKYNRKGKINGLYVFDNSGKKKTIYKSYYLKNRILLGGNLKDQ